MESCTNEKKEITIINSVMASSFKNGNETQRYRCAYSAWPVSYCIIHILTCKGSWADSVFTLLPRHHLHCQEPLKVINVTLKPSFQRKKQGVPEHTHTHTHKPTILDAGTHKWGYNICRIYMKDQIMKNISETALCMFIKFLQTQQLTKVSNFVRESGGFLSISSSPCCCCLYLMWPIALVLNFAILQKNMNAPQCSDAIISV